LIRFTLVGSVREQESGGGVAGLFVKAYDADLLFDDLLGSAVTAADGSFEIVCEQDDFRELFEQRPDIYLRVLARDRATEIWTTEDGVRWRAGRYERFDVRIPRERLGDHAAPTEPELLGDDGEPRTTFAPGESLTLQMRGLRPAAPHAVTLADGDGELFTTSVMTDADGALPPSVLWPLMGIEDPRSSEPVTVEQARERWHGAELELTLRDGERRVAATTLRLDADATRPLVLGVDADGYVRHGFEVGEHDAHVALVDPPAWEAARVWLVPRQHAWRPGDALRPVTLASGRLASADVELGGDERLRSVRVAGADELAPGAYDFVVRRLRYGYADEDDLWLRPDDLLGGHRVTGLVVRERFMASKLIRGGCVNVQKQIAGRYLGIWPYMQFTDTFQVGENVWGALDPAALDPSLIGKMVALYVIPHKTAAQWSVDSSLQHLAVLGGNAAVQRWLTQSWCINANLRLLWANATQVGDYDVVADFGNNTGNAATFVPDDSFDPPLDLIDGYVLPGFKVIPDPTTDTSFAHVGSFQYDETTQGTITVVDDYGTTWSNVPLKASVRFPADAAGATSPSQISAARSSYPVVLIVHGNGPLGGYLGYEYLLAHLAANGFIAASIHMQPNEAGTDRARIARRHLEILFSLFGAHAANNVGLMGHSRGGEAVVIAARLNQQESWGYAINAVISLAPVNQYTFEHFGGAWAAPYLVIYGSLDGDVAGIPDQGFELYDNASGMQKSMVFVYAACHDRFNTVWGDGDLGFGKLTAADQARVVSATTHHDIAKSYMSAFFRQHLRGETQWAGLFRGEWTPATVEADAPGIQIHCQYEDVNVRTVDDFEGAHTATSWTSSTIGDTVSATGLPASPQENDLRTLDAHSPHQTAGLQLAWDTLGDGLTFALPAGSRDVSGYEAVSFRVTQKVNSASNPAGQAQDLRVTLTDGGGHARAIRVSKLATIPYPDVRGYDYYTKSAMRTVRIPLRAFTIKCLNIDAVDLANVVSVAFDLSEKPTGEIAIDSVQFTS
jgi:hypothetical protein